MASRDLVNISRFLSYVLRHKPGAIGLSLDHSGWALISDLLGAANRGGVTLTLELLRQIVAEDEKTRYALSDDGLKIRANYGHTIEIDLGLEALKPPDLLYHGTATRNLDSIKRHGVTSRKRQYVHLSVDVPTAIAVGRRHGRPAILTVEAARMEMKGFKFYRSESGVWLTERVPAEYIVFSRVIIPR